MQRTYLLVGLIVVVAVSGCLGTGGPTPSESTPTASPTPTATPTASSTATDGATTTDSSTTTAIGTPGESAASFAYQITNIAEINDTAREVTVDLTNDGNASAENVRVTTQVYAGNTTADDEQVWDGTEELGEVAVDETVTFSQTIALSFDDALAVESADGWITIVTTIQTADGEVTITSRRNVR